MRVRTPEFNMTILMIDTVEYCGNTKYEEEYGQPDEMMRNYKKLNDQREYIEQQIKNNKYVCRIFIYVLFRNALHLKK